VLELHAEANALTGTFTGRDGEPVAIEMGKVDGDKISFQRTFKRDGNEFVIRFQGKVGPTQIIGKIEFTRDGEARSFDWQADRVTGPADVVGTWNFEVERDNGEIIETRLAVTEDAGKLAGRYTSRQREREVRDIAVKDGTFRFTVAGEYEGTAFRVTYHGKPAGNKIKGQVDYDFDGDAGTVNFTGTRKVASPLAGVWTWARSFQERKITRKLTLAVDGDKLTGTYAGGRGEPVKIEKGTVDGDKIAFVVNRERNGNPFTIQYQGKLTDGRIVGTVAFDRDGETRTRDWEAQRESD
jgi:hypothetical protein